MGQSVAVKLQRNFTVTVNDGNFEVVVRAASSLVFNNVAPSVDLSGSSVAGADNTVFLEESSLFRVNLVSSDATVTYDGGLLREVVVELASAPDGLAERLDASTLGTSIKLTAYVPSTRRLVLSGPAPVEEFTTAIKTLRYQNSRMRSIIGSQPTMTTRQVLFTVRDDTGDEGNKTSAFVAFRRRCTLPLEFFTVGTKTELSRVSPCETIVGGSLVISFTDCVGAECSVQDLSALARLTSIDGSLLVIDVPQLLSFAGVEALRSISGLQVSGNPRLASLQGLSLSTTVFTGSLVITENPVLSSIAALSTLAGVNGDVTLNENSMLESLNGLGRLETVRGNLFVFGSALRDLRGLSRLQSIGGSFYVRNNEQMVSLSGFPVLKTVGGGLVVDSNSKLVDVDGLALLEGVGDAITVTLNPLLCWILRERLTTEYLDFKGLGLDGANVVQTGSACGAVRTCTDGSPCQNGGVCAPTSPAYTCTCTNGFAGLLQRPSESASSCESVIP